MIKTKKELLFFIQADRMMNRGCFEYSLRDRIRNMIFSDSIMDFLVHMRKVEYYSCRKGIVSNILSCYHRMMQRKLGFKLGFNIASNVFGYGLVIPHYGTIVVGGGNCIGNYAVLHTSTCITNGNKIIGDGLYVSTGAKLTTMERLGNNVTIAANSVVTKSCDKSNVLLVGMPAVIKKNQISWYEANMRYRERAIAIEQQKIRMLK